MGSLKPPLLEGGFEGPPFIDHTAAQTNRLSETVLLVAHLEDQLQSELD